MWIGHYDVNLFFFFHFRFILSPFVFMSDNPKKPKHKKNSMKYVPIGCI